MITFFAILPCLAILCATFLGWGFTRREPGATYLSTFMQFDGGHYYRIATRGYAYDPDGRSDLAFFPVYPGIASSLRGSTGISAIISLLLVSNLFFVAAILVDRAYLFTCRFKLPNPAANLDDERATGYKTYALCALAVTPFGFFFHLAYGESCFLFLTIICIAAMERRWPAVWIALIIGLATATRPVGIALVLPFAWHLWRDPCEGGSSNVARPTWCAFALRAIWLVPLACWGLLAYMAFQWAAFSDPLIFAATQTYWRVRAPLPFGEKVLSLASWEPVWSVYVPGVRGYWGGLVEGGWPIFNMQFLNPIFFVATASLVGFGAWRKWLTGYEILLSIPLLLIPYVTKGYDNAMISHARFAAVVFPAYIVVGHLLAKLPRWAAWTILGASAVLMGIYAGEYAAGKAFY